MREEESAGGRSCRWLCAWAAWDSDGASCSVISLPMTSQDIRNVSDLLHLTDEVGKNLGPR